MGTGNKRKREEEDLLEEEEGSSSMVSTLPSPQDSSEKLEEPFELVFTTVEPILSDVISSPSPTSASTRVPLVPTADAQEVSSTMTTSEISSTISYSSSKNSKNNSSNSSSRSPSNVSLEDPCASSPCDLPKGCALMPDQDRGLQYSCLCPDTSRVGPRDPCPRPDVDEERISRGATGSSNSSKRRDGKNRAPVPHPRRRGGDRRGGRRRPNRRRNNSGRVHTAPPHSQNDQEEDTNNKVIENSHVLTSLGSTSSSPLPMLQGELPSSLHTIEDPCQDKPCGPEQACLNVRDKERALPFSCLCHDNTKVGPQDTCPKPEDLGILPSQIAMGQLNQQKLPFQRTELMLASIAATAVMALVVILLLVRNRKVLHAILCSRGSKKQGRQSPVSIAKGSSLLTYNFASNPNYYAQGPDTLPLHALHVTIIDHSQINFTGELGEGCFGKVYKGSYIPRPPDEEGNRRGSGVGQQNEEDSITVAIKVLKESAGTEQESDFLREVEIMSAFMHDNILQLIGIVTKGSDLCTSTPWMVFEYMAHGDLAEVLRSCSPPYYTNTSSIKELSPEDLLHMSIQIACGMEYLSSQHFVHRDLACRNCLCGDNLIVKISDFGMSRDVYTSDYYKVGGSRLLPVRWMSPESIMYGKFTLESDVWSFGVVLWEIYAFGKQPYFGNSNEEVVNLILQGILLNPPETCPARVCDVMRRCWATDPQDRLKFTEILSLLKRILAYVKYSSTSSTPQSTPPTTPTTPTIPPIVADPPSPISTTPGAAITYSQLCLKDDMGLQLDHDEYLLPRMHQPREYLQILTDV